MPKRHGIIELDQQARMCRVSGADVPMTSTEFQLLSCLMADPRRLNSRAHLIASLWGAPSQVSDRTFDSHLRNLRRKLAEAGCADAIESVHGQGIRLGQGA